VFIWHFFCVFKFILFENNFLEKFQDQIYEIFAIVIWRRRRLAAARLCCALHSVSFD
jgi:hypothetical protein